MRKKKQWKPFQEGDRAWEEIRLAWERHRLNVAVLKAASQVKPIPFIATAEDFALWCIKVCKQDLFAAWNMFLYNFGILIELKSISDNSEPIPLPFEAKRAHFNKIGQKIDVYCYHEYLGYTPEQCAVEFNLPLKTVYRTISEVHELIYGEKRPTKKIREQDLEVDKSTVDKIVDKSGKLTPEAKRYINQDSRGWIKYKHSPSIKRAERFFAKQQDSGRRTPKLHEEEPDEQRPISSILVGQLDRSQSGTAFKKLIERSCIKQFLEVDGYENCGYEPGSERCSGCNHLLEVEFWAAELNKWHIEPGRWDQEINFEIGGVFWRKYVKSYTHAPVSGVPKEGIPKECYLAYRYQIIFEQTVFEHKRNLPRSKELKWQGEYSNVRPWVIKYTWGGEKTIRTSIIAVDFGPTWLLPIAQRNSYYWPLAPVVPCADCGGECPDDIVFPCDKLSMWTKHKHFQPRGKKYKRTFCCPQCGDLTSKTFKGVWVCSCGKWFTPPLDRHKNAISQFTKTLATKDVEDYLISLIDEGREHGIDDLFEIVLAAPIDGVSLGVKENTVPLIIKEWQPLLGPWLGIYKDVYDGYPDHYTMWLNKYVNQTFHLIEPEKKYRPKVTSEREVLLTRILKKSLNENLYSEERILFIR